MNLSHKSSNKNSSKFLNSTLDSFVVKEEIVKDINAVSNQGDNNKETPNIDIIKPDYKLYLELSLNIFFPRKYFNFRKNYKCPIFRCKERSKYIFNIKNHIREEHKMVNDEYIDLMIKVRNTMHAETKRRIIPNKFAGNLFKYKDYEKMKKLMNKKPYKFKVEIETAKPKIIYLINSYLNKCKKVIEESEDENNKKVANTFKAFLEKYQQLFSVEDINNLSNTLQEGMYDFNDFALWTVIIFDMKQKKELLTYFKTNKDIFNRFLS